jgi:hypothetical protein
MRGLRTLLLSLALASFSLANGHDTRLTNGERFSRGNYLLFSCPRPVLDFAHGDICDLHDLRRQASLPTLRQVWNDRLLNGPSMTSRMDCPITRVRGAFPCFPFRCSRVPRDPC